MLFFIWKRRNKSYQIEKKVENQKRISENQNDSEKTPFFSLRSSRLEYFINFFCGKGRVFMPILFWTVQNLLFYSFPQFWHIQITFGNKKTELNYWIYIFMGFFGCLWSYMKPNDTLGTKYKMTFLASIFEFFITLSLCCE